MQVATLTINAGSSSVRLALYGAGPTLIRSRRFELPVDRRMALLSEFVAQDRVEQVAHRVVHGGTLPSPAEITSKVKATVTEMAPLAPLHNPVALEWIA